MKLNNLSTPSRVILSNPTRVILSVAKDLAIAASLFAFAACSDYLEDFQDKYDDGNAFAEISSDSDNGSDDSELSSSSKGDVESSDSTDSSSSATDPGSSSSVAESSSSAFESCTGTVIYDAEEDPEFNRFGRKFITYDQVYNSDSSKISSDGVTAYLSHGGSLTMPLAASPNTMNIGPWGGFCVEYTGSGDLHANVVDESSGNKPILLYKEMPNTNGEKSSFTWSWNENKSLMELMEEQKNSNLSDGFSIEKVNSIDFSSYSGNSSITIHKITTLNSDVHFECDGSEIFPTGRIFQVFNNWSSSGQKMGEIKPSDDKYEILLSGGNSVAPNNEEAIKQELANAHGFCMEYSSDNYFLLSLTQYVDGNQKKTYAKREVGKGNQRVVFVRWDELKEQFTNFDPQEKHMLELSAPKNGVEATNITISRMTLLD
ncbi:MULTISPECIES: hypothetical protein [unclassified Fibrobacter]|uniref:hypothetical protein n=1 Tax=unclassified Fibrobacter TaxID=2634177 RepID=UPI000D6B7A61|nr:MULTISPECIES: hypothetical protein [unclassified Fibrobacter]PWJ61032.1 hypothetical protein BGX12_1318 [Fibrobacter sp. UWR4]PZW68053.1 hypothetical protein C8E88_102129 [Fibrobacter sp. UWR1]